MKFYKNNFSTFKKSGAKQWSKTVEQNSGVFILMLLIIFWLHLYNEVKKGGFS
jgi:hypothetical protein